MTLGTLTGRLFDVRSMGKRLAFGTLRTPTGEVQCVFDSAPDVPAESIVEVTGEVGPAPASTRFATEVKVSDWRLVAANHSPVGTRQLKDRPYSKEILPLQHVYMRLPEVQRHYRAKWTATKLIRDLLTEQDYLEVQSPRIVGSMADGATGKFKVDFFGQQAFLSLSNLLFHTAFVAGDFDSIFEVSPLFRADENRSSQHVSEFWILEVTAAYRTREDLMALADGVVARLCRHADPEAAVVSDRALTDIPVLTYREVCRITERGDGPTLPVGTRIKRYHATQVVEHLGRPLFWVVDMPAAHKAFFSSTRTDEGSDLEVANDFRLFFDEIDVVDGGERITDADRALARLGEHGLDPANFDYYLDVLRSGVPPLTGFGLGIERLLCKAMGLENIRQLVPFPRFMGHLEP